MVWIAADLNFFSKIEADNLSYSIEEYNNFIIRNWNEAVEENDTVIILGKITENDDEEEMTKIFSQLNGTISYECMNNDKDFVKKWERIGCEFIGNLNNFVVGIIDDEETSVRIYNDKIYYQRAIKNIGLDKIFIAVPQSISNIDEPYKNGVLNISLKKWGYAPLSYDSLPNLINSMRELEEMENFE
jgi:calcineurin-like phosphoesterase family protein